MSANNIFIPSFGNKPDRIVGRDSIIAEFSDGLLQPIGHKKRASLVIGQRGFGKTALLLEFADLATRMGYVAARVTAGRMMLDEIIETIQREGERCITSHRPRVKGFSAGAVGFSFGLSFAEDAERQYGFRSKLTMLCDELAKHGKKVLILVDEVQPNDETTRSLATTYQHLVGDSKEVAIVMAGLPSSISGVLNDRILTFLNRAHKIHLGQIPLGEISIYYRNAFKRMHKGFAPNVLEMAAGATRGYPYLLQLIGYYLASYSENETEISTELAALAIADARREMVESIFEPVLRPLSTKDRDFLKAMSKDVDTSRIAEIAARMEVSQAYAQRYRRRLIEAGVVAQADRGELRFAVPYLGERLRGEF
jgi:hypothetical protein